MTPVACATCGEELKAGWVACPVCATAVQRSATPLMARPGPAAAEGRNSLVVSGVVLIVLAVLGVVGLLYGMTAEGLPKPEMIVTIGGGAAVAMIAGHVLMTTGLPKNARTASAVAGGLMTGLMVAGIVAITILALIVYALQDCLNSCGGKPHH
ncbi:MAG: hypothetical protein U0746_05510 [Gemmataceae bacterium]